MTVVHLRDVIPRGRLAAATRAQSESIGVILLTAVIVLLVGGFGMVYLGTIDGSGQGPLVDAEINATDEWLSITHGGGESVPYADLEVVIRSDGQSERHALNEWSEANDDTFGPSDRIRGEHARGSGQLTVLLVHTASNTVVEEAYLDARGEDDDDETDSVTANFTSSPTDPEPGEAVAFDASDSTGEGAITTYEWDWNGDGSVDDVRESATYTFENPGTYTVSLTVTDAEGNTDRRNQSIVVGSTPPTLDRTSLTDGDDDLVTTGDTVSVSATVTPGSSDIDTVTANASSFDAGDVTLTDGDVDGTYDATFAVGELAVDGDQNVTIEVRDAAGVTVSAETEDSITIDTTPPTINTFDVTDNSGSVWIFPYVNYDVEWSVTDEHLAMTTVFVNDTTATDNPQETHQGARGFETTGGFQDYDRTYRFKILTVDEAGNSQCALVVDQPNDGAPPSTEAC